MRAISGCCYGLVTSPTQQVIVPKDAVLPVAGGHMVYLAIEGKARRQIIQLEGPVEGGFIVKKALVRARRLLFAEMSNYPMEKILTRAAKLRVASRGCCVER